MSFWQLNDGTEAATTTNFEMGGGEIEVIPNNTQLIAAIEEAKWATWEGDSYINLKWRVMRPTQYGNRVIFQKLKVFGMAGDKDKAATADKAKQMLRAIDANAGGKLSKLNVAPEDTNLMTALVGKPMAIKVQVWEMNDKKGNWISAVAPAKQQAPAAQSSAPQPLAQNAHNQAKSNGYQPQARPELDDDDLPF